MDLDEQMEAAADAVSGAHDEPMPGATDSPGDPSCAPLPKSRRLCSGATNHSRLGADAVRDGVASLVFWSSRTVSVTREEANVLVATGRWPDISLLSSEPVASFADAEERRRAESVRRLTPLDLFWSVAAWAPHIIPELAACLVETLLRMGLADDIRRLGENDHRSFPNPLTWCLECPALMHALLDVPPKVSGLDVNLPLHAHELLSVAVGRLTPGARGDPRLCLRLLRLMSPHNLHVRHGNKLHLLINFLFQSRGGVSLVIPLIRECIALAGPGGDGVDLTWPCEYGNYGEEQRLWTSFGHFRGLKGTTVLRVFDCMRALYENQHQDLPLSQFAPFFGECAALRRELVNALNGIAKYRNGGLHASAAAALRETGLHQPELIALVVSFVLVPLANEAALAQPLALSK
jgi:hypothetical protein